VLAATAALNNLEVGRRFFFLLSLGFSLLSLAGHGGGGERGLRRSAELEAARVLLSMRIGAALDGGSHCLLLIQFLLRPALVARGGGGRRGGRLKAPLSLHVGAASPFLEDGVKP
jgi:hypothetical protein